MWSDIRCKNCKSPTTERLVLVSAKPLNFDSVDAIAEVQPCRCEDALTQICCS
jgi:hypothetical protein